ncbi:hypothetical protein C1646_754071 [Rhizophagus diaphanus]|nr:hypothetical protein C1646_754071 [Rhizophagus diaphanus] [Rhizophagus sp. MUCL 43196]
MVFQTPLQTPIIETKHDEKALHIVILEVDSIPNINEEIFNAAKMYKNDFSLSSNEYLDIIADESIFWQLINLQKDYGIFDLAAAVGIKYMDKLKKVVDYQATVWIIKLIWVSVGNFNIQKNTLATFSPLLPSAGKSNYTQSVSHFFGILEQYPKLEEKLQVAGSFKVSEDRFGHFMAFDKALETFGECYKQGLHRIHLIYAQEVLKKEKIDTTGRRVKEVLVTKYKDIEKPSRKRKNTNILDNQPGSSDKPPKKRVRRISSKEAVKILAPMVAHSLPPTKEEVQRYLAALEGIFSSSDIWNATQLTHISYSVCDLTELANLDTYEILNVETILEPAKNTVKSIEGKNATIAEVFLALIQMPTAIKALPTENSNMFINKIENDNDPFENLVSEDEEENNDQLTEDNSDLIIGNLIKLNYTEEEIEPKKIDLTKVNNTKENETQ